QGRIRWAKSVPQRPKNSLPIDPKILSDLRPAYDTAKGHFPGYFRDRKLFTASKIRQALSATSAAVVKAPKLSRIALPTSPSESPIATSVCEGSAEPLAHAEPVEQATPARSSAMTRAWRSSPRKETHEVLGSRGARSPMTTISGSLARSSCSS